MILVSGTKRRRRKPRYQLIERFLIMGLAQVVGGNAWKSCTFGTMNRLNCYPLPQSISIE